MGMLRSALKTGIAVKLVNVARREAAKPENQRKAKELVTRVRREVAKPENQRKAKELATRLRTSVAKSPKRL